MPLDTSSAMSGKSSKMSKRTSRLSSLIEDSSSVSNVVDSRARLHLLFSQIEKEFEALYLENVSRE